MKVLLERLFLQETLTAEEARSLLLEITSGTMAFTLVSAILAAFRMRPVTVAELEGFRAALLERCIPVDLGSVTAVDLCGTGGDGKNTFNISTTAAFIVAGSGQAVAKHGNYAVSSNCGSSNVLEALEVPMPNQPELVRACCEECGICFMHAPFFHPTLGNIAPLRRELGVQTVFNILGPLVNPAQPLAQSTGVFNPILQRLYSYVLERTDIRYLVVHALDGYDEISLTGPCRLVFRGETQLVEAADFGLAAIDQQELHAPGGAAESAVLMERILSGAGTSAQTAVACANAAAALHCVGLVDRENNTSLLACFERAQRALMDGAALRVLRRVQAFGRRTGKK